MTGTWPLIRLILRRDRVLLPLWVLILCSLPATYAASFEGLLPDATSRHQYLVTTADTPSMVSLLGPVFGDSIGALTAQRVGILYAIVALISLLTASGRSGSSLSGTPSPPWPGEAREPSGWRSWPTPPSPAWARS